MRRKHPVLFVAFAFAVMADPVSSVAYAIEAALRAVDGDLTLLLPTMTVVLGIIALVVLNYRQLVVRYPGGGGAAAAAGEAFGDAWSFIPMGALVVDFVLTIAISVSAATSALIASLPDLATFRLEIAWGLLVLVAGLTWFGHLGRVVFALMTLTFLVVVVAVLVCAALTDPVPGSSHHVAEQAGRIAGQGLRHPAWQAPVAVLVAFPVGMALATGVEAPASAIAQLDELDDRGRSGFGRATLWLTLAVVASITLGLVAAIRSHHLSTPGADTTLVAELARQVSPATLFGAFQAVTALLLLAAASSSFQAGPGLLKALSHSDERTGVLPEVLGRTNRRHTPYWSVLVFLTLALVVVTAAGAQEQELVLFYAVAVFVSFLAGLLAMVRFSRLSGARGSLALNAAGAAAVAFTLVVNLARVRPVLSLVAALAVAAALHHLWVRAGKPAGIRHADARRNPRQAPSRD